MSDSKKALVLGVGISLALAAVAAVLSNEKTQTKVAGFVNKQKVKHYVKSEFEGNDKAMAAIDRMSDEEVNTFMELITKTSDLQDSLVDGLGSIRGIGQK